MFLTDVEAESLSYEASLPVAADSQFPRVSSCCLACLPGHHKATWAATPLQGGFVLGSTAIPS